MPTLRARIASRSGGISCFKRENPFFRQSPQWAFAAQVKAAAKSLQQAREVEGHAPCQGSTLHRSSGEHGRYSCYLCQGSFPLRKHLHAHLACTHRVFSPARHYATSETCPCCMRRGRAPNPIYILSALADLSPHWLYSEIQAPARAVS